MTKTFNKIFSMPLMVLFLLLFFLAIGWATFVENDFGRLIAYKWVYAANWFGFILFYLSISLIYNIFRFKLLRWKKISSLLFHAAFLVIVLGALVTRLFGFEGVMMIREGEASSTIISAESYLQVKVHDNVDQWTDEVKFVIDTNAEAYTSESIVWNHPFSFLFNHNNYLEYNFEFKGKNVEIKTADVFKNPKDSLIPTAGGDAYIDLVTNGMQSNYLREGEIKVFDSGIKVAFNNDVYTDAINIFETDSGIYVLSPFDLGYFQMSDQSQGSIKRDSIQEFIPKRLYTVGNEQFVFKNYYLGAKLETFESDQDLMGLMGIDLAVSVDGGEEQNHIIKGGKGIEAQTFLFEQDGLNFEIGYGSKDIEIPFMIELRDFQLDNYPGTMNPASFASEVTLIDLEKGVEEEHRIFMNTVLDYEGYRFFQSSYDKDELGTILSVNHDNPGTILTYLGYLFLAIGFIINLMAREGRFRKLSRKTTEVRAKREGIAVLLFLMTLGGFNSSAQETTELQIVDEAHAAKFSELMIQSYTGRFSPVHTVADELVRKIHRGTEYKEMNPMQVFLGIHTNPAWFQEPFIYISGTGVREEYNIVGKYGALSDFLFFTETGITYLLAEEAEDARIKKPANRSQYDKNILKTDERVNIMFGLFNYSYLKIFPNPAEDKSAFYSYLELNGEFSEEDSTFVQGAMKLYFNGILKGYESGDWSEADQAVDLIDVYQQKAADPAVLMSDTVLGLEIWYNEADIFQKIQFSYLLLGLFSLILVFLQMFIPGWNLKWPIRITALIFGGLFLYHGFGLGLRWYLSGHAPWSNGYEAVVFISWVTVGAGLMFYLKSKVVIGAVGILAWLMLFVAHMNHMDPVITDLVPVLQSYWLMIHVAIITGSYGFLGLGSVMSLINLCTYIFANNKNRKTLTLVTKEVSSVAEMTIMIGLFMLTIGTFLGGVWANESWGRYWGWDAKETWALASVLVYAIVLHIRFIPKMKSQFAFSFWSFWAYGSIIMTFFGVNYYLAGLHSYAKGDPLPIPIWVPITVGGFLLLCIVSFFGWKRLKKLNQSGKEEKPKMADPEIA
jgi:cytochrome c-type biogenesis protein CcsB